MRYKKHFTFYANAPIDRGGVDVPASQIVHTQALEGLSVFDMGAESGVGIAAQEWADFNFSPLQKTLFAPIPPSVNIAEINYLRVDFYDGEYTEENDVPAHTFFYFIDDAKPDDEGESLNGEALTFFALTLDPWATNVLYGNPRFFGGEITATSDITPERFPHVSADALVASAVTFPFSVERWQSDGNEQNEFNIIPAVKLNKRTGEARFRILISMTGKNFRRTVFAITTRIFDGLLDAINAAQYMATSDKVFLTKKHDYNAPEEYETLKEGEWSLQAIYIVPQELAPEPASTPKSYYLFEALEFNENFELVVHLDFFLRDISSPENAAPLSKRLDINFRELYAKSLGAETPEEIAELLEDEFGGLRPCMRVDVGTPTNRVDITEQVFKNGTTTRPDAFINAVYGYQTFNIFLHVAGRKIDITNDFQTYTLLDPENEFIKQNKTNSILSGIGSVGTIVGGVVAIAGSGGAGAGVGAAAIASGATSLISNISRWQEAATVPDVIKGVGYADTTNLYGGVYLTATRKINAWARAVAVNGFKTQVLTGGEWFINPLYEKRAGDCFLLCVDGARVTGMPAGDAEEIATMLKRGVRLWYDAAAWAERSI